ncbi:Multiple organellar RNA editing factor 8, chloroplastic/mitochondrial [Linum perenne]
MAAATVFSRSILLRHGTTAVLSRCFSSSSSSVASSHRPYSIFRSLRSLSAVAPHFTNLSPTFSATRCFSTRMTSSSLSDPSPNWSNRPPKETILLDGCDFEHWLVVMEKPENDPTRDEIIDSYIKTLAQVVGSEEEARMKIYSVSTRHYFAFGALVSEELSYKLKELPGVRWVLPDSYLDVRNKDYGGEPFINGQAVPYDPKYHEEWVRNNARANERNRRNDRPRNFDRSRNFDRRRENTQSRDFQNPQVPPPGGNQAGQNPGFQPNVGGPGAPQPHQPQYPPQHNMGGPGVPPPQRPPQYPQRNIGGPGAPPPPNNQMGGWPQNNQPGYGPPPTQPPHNQMGGGAPPNTYGGVPQGNNMGRMPPPNMGGGSPPAQGNPGWSNGGQGNFQNGPPPPPNDAGMPYQGDQPGYPQNGYPPNRDGNLPRY